MVRSLVIAALFVSTVACAQSSRNRVERTRNRQEARQDKRQLKDDRRDAARTLGLLSDYDAAAAANDVPRLGALDVSFNDLLNQELAEASREVSADRRELRGDTRVIRQDVGQNAIRGDARDRRDDRRDLADDRRDAAKERGSAARLLEIQAQLAPLALRFDRPSIAQKRSLYGEVLGLAFSEIHRDKQERREDRRERREGPR